MQCRLPNHYVDYLTIYDLGSIKVLKLMSAKSASRGKLFKVKIELVEQNYKDHSHTKVKHPEADCNDLRAYCIIRKLCLHFVVQPDLQPSGETSGEKPYLPKTIS